MKIQNDSIQWSYIKLQYDYLCFMKTITSRVFSNESDGRTKPICFRSVRGEQGGEKFIPPIVSITLSLINGPLSISVA